MIMCPTRSERCWRPSVCFFFSSRRRHTRSDRDWSSDVCSSDHTSELQSRSDLVCRLLLVTEVQTCRSEERRVGKSVDLGGRRIIKKKKGSVEDSKGYTS